ncbi:MAG: hypothetical protein HUK04_05340 [Bacteroidaceae bacterium]|nr:hypothetical protein [Bacteroidaceae bacterium]
MRHNLFAFKSILLALACLLGISQAHAGADWPAEGKAYRIKNIYGAAYITMNANDKASVTLNDEELNSEFQFWEVIKAGTGYRFRNIGWNKKGSNVYLTCNTPTQGALVTTSESTGDTSLFNLVETVQNNWDCFNIVPTAATSLSLNSNMAATQFTLAQKTANGSHWIFEEATLRVPEIVTLKSARSGKYIAENTTNQLVQSGSVTELCKWIKYQTADGYIFINNSTHNYIQAPLYNQQVKTGREPVALYGEQGDGVWAFGYGGQYLNETQTWVCGWKQGLADKGSTWVVNKVGDITEEEVIAIMEAGSPYLDKVTEGQYFRMYCELLDMYVCDDYRNSRIGGRKLDEKDMTQIWQAEAVGKESFYLRNVGTGEYIKADAKEGALAQGAREKSTAFEPVINYAFSSVNKYFNFIMDGGTSLNMAGQGYVETYYPGSKEMSGAEWLLCRVEKVDDNAVKAEREAFEAYIAVSDEFEQMVKDKEQTQQALDGLFADKACTTLTAYAKAMGDMEFEAQIASLPRMIQDMCRKIRSEAWTKTKGGRDLDKFFRIADYRAYSNSEWMHKVVGVTNEYSRLSNPTGISGDAGDIFAIFVDKDCPAGASLKLEITDGGEKDRVTFGDQYTLHTGMNLFQATKSCDLFIFYEVNSADDKSANRLDNFDDIKIHIEGGKTNGMFDLTRGMDDDEWADMVASGMLTHGRVYLKGSHAIGNWPSSILLPANKTTIKSMAEFYDNIVAWDQQLLGISDTYIPGISKRFNNIYMALGSDVDGYMYATSYGTYYSWSTLETILNPNVLRNGGNQWGPSHEFGHNHQELINLVGCTEVSNNLFANMVVYKMGASMSRGKALSNLIPNYANRRNWIEIDIWCKTQMYWKLYQYFHLAGHDTEFFPKVVNRLREKGLRHENGRLVPATDDYLLFAEACCEVAGADLSDFFQMYGFFDLIANDSEQDGVACKKVDDYSVYYLYVTQDMIDATIAKCHSYDKKMKNIGFIDDRIRQTPATYPGAPAGTMRTALNGGGDNSVGTEGTVGMYLDYMPENYKRASGYTAKSVRLSASGTGKILTVAINNDGEGAMGFKVLDSDDELLYFYNDFSFTVPTEVYKRKPYTAETIIILAADAQGNDYVVYKGRDYSGTADGIDTVQGSADTTATGIYDLQGRRLSHCGKGVFVVNGKKVVAKE